jgi:hypothetical protein
VAFDSTRLLVQIGVLRGAKRTTKDVGGAYLWGTPTPPEAEHGRALFVKVPPGFAHFGFPETDKQGRPMYFEIVGNLPGRQDAGRIWGGCYDKFLCKELKELIGVGFRPSVVDPRIYMLVRGHEYVLTAIYVDDNLFVHSGGALWDEFEAAWSKRFKEPVNASESLDEFCGLLLEDSDDGSTAISAPHVLQSLGGALAAHPLPTSAICDTPLAGDALRTLKEPPSESNPLMSAEHTQIAQSLTGIAGWISGTYRFDAYLAFVAVAQHVPTNLTRRVWNAVLRWCHYLINTRDVKLHFRPVGLTAAAAADSSCLNGPEPGSSYGGYLIGFPGSGAFQIACLVPRKLSDSSAGAEAILACQCVKAIAGVRMLLDELGLKQHEPTPMAMDASAVIDGSKMTRVTKASRWLAARMGILKQMISDRVMRLVKAPTETHTPDLFTKPVTDLARFVRLRNNLLGAHQAVT